MVIDTLGKQTQSVRNELGDEPSVHEIVRIRTEEVSIPKIVVQVTQSTIGASWIVGSSTNGKVGTNTSTQSGGQQVVGGSGRVYSLQKVLNDNNEHYELFRYTTFKDATATTGDWTTSGTAEIALNEILQSGTIYKDTGSATSATMSVDFTTGSAGTIYAYLSSTGTATNQFGTATLDSEYTFPTSGRNMCWKIKGRSNTIINKVKISYNTN